MLGRGPALMSGYWRNPDATAEALRDGFMHTGDLGYRDEEGYLYLVDRRNDKIVTGGENVFPSEVENVIVEPPGGARGRRDRRAGPHVGRGGRGRGRRRRRRRVSPTSSSPTAARSLAGYKVPKQIRFARARELPRTPTGKLLRRDLRRTWPSDGG